MSEKQTETSTGGQDMGPFKAGAPSSSLRFSRSSSQSRPISGSSDLSMVRSSTVWPLSVGCEHDAESVVLEVFEAVG